MLTTTLLFSGVHAISAMYSGDAILGPVMSDVLSETVNQGTSQLGFGSSSTTALSGTPLTFAVALTGTGSQPGGTVVLKSDGTIITTVSVDSGVLGSFSTSGLAAGTHRITASYGGDTKHTGSAGAPITVTISQATSAVQLSSSVNPGWVRS